MFKRITVLFLVSSIVCGLHAAYINDYDKRFNLINHQSHFKTPLGVPYQGSSIIVDKRILNTKHVPFIEHPDGNSSWLGITFDFQYVKPIFDLVNSTEEKPLLNRGEAHATVISPPEFAVLAKADITVDQMNEVAISHAIQSSKVDIVCLGKEDVVIQGQQRIVYQIIIKSKDLIKIRKRLFQLYVEKGGNTSLFDPNVLVK
ncbi:MAG: hypothetical protein EXX96DRAFT_590237 [Benjaminiella poitrasii]|nr:MAG: hypothetical protein EXX96DRAFT_590237 [Benjaminiella poitrasii]